MADTKLVIHRAYASATTGGALVSSTVEDSGAPMWSASVGGGLVVASITDLGGAALFAVIGGALVSATIEDDPDVLTVKSVNASTLFGALVFAAIYADIDPAYLAVVYVPQGEILSAGSVEGQILMGGSAAGEAPWRYN